MRAVVTVTGKDKQGIIAKVSAILAEVNANIEDISQTILQEFFAMIMIIDLSKASLGFSELVDLLDKKGLAIGMSIRMQHEDIFNAMHKI